MKPKTKLQKQVAELSAKLPALTGKQEAWAKQHSVEHMGFRTKKGITCTECGFLFTDTKKVKDGKKDVCPHCGTKISIETTRKKKDREIEYFCVITTCKGFQVMRYFYIQRYCRAGQKAHYYIDEVIQRWMLPDGTFETIAKIRLMNSAYIIDMWSHTSKLEVRAYDHSAYHVSVNAVYPIKRFLPDWRKYGIKGKTYGFNPFDFVRKIKFDNRAETFLKVGQFGLLSYLVGEYDYKIVNHWPSIKICMRNNYIVKDASMWLDYLDMLEHFHKDLHNAHYVCPANLKVAHDYYAEKKRKEDEKAQREKNMKRMLALKAAAEEYVKEKSKFFDLQISDGQIVIAVLKSLEEFQQEGEAMHHCVFANQYFKKKDALILSARVGEKRIETVEVNLKTLDVVQSRGVCNKSTEYHDRIVRLVKNNIGVIRQRIIV